MLEILGFVFIFAIPFIIVGFPLYIVMKIYRETKKLKDEIAIKVTACTVIPTKVLPFSKFNETQLLDIIDYHVVCNEVQRLVSTGKTQYSSHTVFYLGEMFKGYLITNYVWRGHPRLLFWTGMHWFGVLVVGLQAHATSKLELIFNEYFRGALIKTESAAPNIPTTPHSSSSSADEILKLHKLKQDGILSDAEFQNAKRRLVG